MVLADILSSGILGGGEKGVVDKSWASVSPFRFVVTLLNSFRRDVSLGVTRVKRTVDGMAPVPGHGNVVASAIAYL